MHYIIHDLVNNITTICNKIDILLKYNFIITKIMRINIENWPKPMKCAQLMLISSLSFFYFISQYEKCYTNFICNTMNTYQSV